MGSLHKPFHHLIEEVLYRIRGIQTFQLFPSVSAIRIRRLDSFYCVQRWEEHVPNVIIPPRTQKNIVAPTELVPFMMADGVLYIPVPTTRLIMRNAVDHTPSLRSCFD
jgi:hypothetical protein